MTVGDAREYEQLKAEYMREFKPGGACRPLPVLMFDEISAHLANNYLVKELLGSSAMAVVYGDSNTGKTFFALDLGLHIALGRDWIGRRVHAGGVIYVAAEGGPGAKNRIVAFRQHHAITLAVPFGLVTTAIDLCTDNANTGDLIATVKSVSETLGVAIVLVVIDTLSRAMAGGNESAPDDMGSYVRNIDLIRQATGAHVLSVHHTGKDQARGARGHSLLRAATDTEIEITREEATGLSAARITKQRDLPLNEDQIIFGLKQVEIGVNDDGDTVASCVVVPHGAAASPSPKRKRLKGKPKLALEQLHNCIITMGQPAPKSKSIPEGVSGVTPNQWREYLGKAGIINMSSGYREQFSRIRVTLGDAGYIGVWEDFVWCVT
jgi:hypothetical protein